jgi:hypothetical protein
MALVTVNLVDTFDEWRIKTNSISSNGGDLTTLTTTDKSDLVSALNEVKTTSTNNLIDIVEDTTPELGGNLNLNSNDITGTGNINITGTLTATLASTTTAVTQSLGDNSTKVATTAYVSTTVSSTSVGGDLTGSISNSQINSNVVGITELNVTDGTAGQLLSTNGSGTLSFITPDLTLSGDLSGTLSNAQLGVNVVGISELNLSDGTNGQVVTTDGAGTISFQSVFSETTVSPSIGQTVFTISYKVGRIVVFLNGVKLLDGVDFTASNGTSVTLTTGTQFTTDRVEFNVFS